MSSWPDPRIKSEGKLVPAIYVLRVPVKMWMPATSAGMTECNKWSPE